MDQECVLCWDTTFGGASEDHAHGIALLPSGFVLAGYTESAGAGEQDGLLVRLDAEGNKIWEKTFGGPGHDRFFDVVALEGGHVMAIGAKQEADPAKFDVWLVRVNPSGDVVWEQTYENDGDDQGNGIALANNGENLVVVGKKANDGLVMKVDLAGGVVWEEVVPGTEGGTNAFYDVAVQKVTPNSDVYVAVGARPGPAGLIDAWVVLVSNNAAATMEYTYGGTGWDMAFGVDVKPDHTTIVAGSKGNPGESWYKNPWLFKLNENSEMVWEISWGDPAKSFESAEAVRITPDDTYVVVGRVFDDVLDSQFFIKEVAEGGNVLVENEFGGAKNELGTFVEVVDGGYVTGGYTASQGFGVGDAWLIFCDKDGLCEL